MRGTCARASASLIAPPRRSCTGAHQDGPTRQAGTRSSRRWARARDRARPRTFPCGRRTDCARRARRADLARRPPARPPRSRTRGGTPMLPATSATMPLTASTPTRTLAGPERADQIGDEIARRPARQRRAHARTGGGLARGVVLRREPRVRPRAARSGPRRRGDRPRCRQPGEPDVGRLRAAVRAHRDERDEILRPRTEPHDLGREPERPHAARRARAGIDGPGRFGQEVRVSDERAAISVELDEARRACRGAAVRGQRHRVEQPLQTEVTGGTQLRVGTRLRARAGREVRPLVEPSRDRYGEGLGHPPLGVERGADGGARRCGRWGRAHGRAGLVVLTARRPRAAPGWRTRRDALSSPETLPSP